MELSDLHVFRTVVEAGGVLRAADRLHRVPSNVTTRIRKLEADLGVTLFLREGRRLRISPTGRVLLDYAERLLALAEEARDALHDDQPRGTLRLGSMESTAAGRLPGPLSLFHQRYPDVAVELQTGATAPLTDQLLAGELDAALVLEPVSDPRLDSQTAFVEEPVIIAASDHPPIRTPRDVRNRTLLAFHHGCPYRQRLEEWFAQGDQPPERLVELASYHAILGCTVAGMGVALVPRSVLATFGERVHLSIHPLTGKFRSARILLIWRKGVPSAKVRALAAILAETTAKKPRR
jgi:DNA-binding transcriptional LysR family regulator